MVAPILIWVSWPRYHCATSSALRSGSGGGSMLSNQISATEKIAPKASAHHTTMV